MARYKRRVLAQATYRIGRGRVATHFTMKFPTGKQAVGTERLRGVLFACLPRYMGRSFCCGGLSTHEVQSTIRLTRSRRTIHSRLGRRKLITFITSSTMLPQRDKVSSQPVGRSMTFASPRSLEIAVRLPRENTIANVKVPGKVALVINNNCRKGSALLATLRLNICGRVTKSNERFIVASRATLGLHSRSKQFVGSISVSVFVGSLPGKGSARRFSARSTDKDASRTTKVIRNVRTKDHLFLLSRSASTAGFVMESTFVRGMIDPSGRPVAPFLSHTHSLCRRTKVSAVLMTNDSNTFFRVTSAIVRVSHCGPISVAGGTGTLYGRFPVSRRGPRPFTLPRDRQVVRGSGGNTAGHESCQDKTIHGGRPRQLGLGAVKASKFTVKGRAISLQCLRRLVSDRRATYLNVLLGCTIRRLISNGQAVTRIIMRLRGRLRASNVHFLTRGNVISNNCTVPQIRRVCSYFGHCHM